MKTYRYFVSCNINEEKMNRFTHHEITRIEPISNIDDIIDIASEIENDLELPMGSVTVLFYRLFDDADK